MVLRRRGNKCFSVLSSMSIGILETEHVKHMMCVETVEG